MMKLVRLLRLLKLNKLLRFSDVGSRWKRWIYYSREGNLVRLVMLLVGMLVMVHFMACIWNSMGHGRLPHIHEYDHGYSQRRDFSKLIRHSRPSASLVELRASVENRG
jgi:hypothetical protein